MRHAACLRLQCGLLVHHAAASRRGAAGSCRYRVLLLLHALQRETHALDGAKHVCRSAAGSNGSGRVSRCLATASCISVVVTIIEVDHNALLHCCPSTLVP